jgi:alpha-1,2-mannosyltransferase
MAASSYRSRRQNILNCRLGPTAATPSRMSTGWSRTLMERKKIHFCCGVLLALELAVFLFMIAGTHGLIVPLDKPTSSDFVSFYAAGNLAAIGVPQLAYDKAEHRAAEERATEAGIDYNFFYYPPTFLLICTALAHLPYLTALLIFDAATLCLYLLVARRIIGEPSLAVLVPLLAFPPLLWTLGLGQNALLTAALFGAATLLIDDRPVVAGILFGAICYKPQFGLLIPVALAAGGYWRVFAASFISALALCVLSLVCFGWDTWHGFLTAAMGSSAVYTSGRIPFTGYVNPFGAVRQLGGAPNLAYAVQAGSILIAVALVAFVWRRKLPLPIRAAALASSALIAAPLALFYDLMLSAVAALWLLHGDGKDRLADWEKIALAGLLFLSLSPRSLAEALHLPVGPFIVLALTAMVAARASHCTAILSREATGKSLAKAGDAPRRPWTAPNTRARPSDHSQPGLVDSVF